MPSLYDDIPPVVGGSDSGPPSQPAVPRQILATPRSLRVAPESVSVQHRKLYNRQPQPSLLRQKITALRASAVLREQATVASSPQCKSPPPQAPVATGNLYDPQVPNQYYQVLAVRAKARLTQSRKQSHRRLLSELERRNALMKTQPVDLLLSGEVAYARRVAMSTTRPRPTRSHEIKKRRPSPWDVKPTSSSPGSNIPVAVTAQDKIQSPSPVPVPVVVPVVTPVEMSRSSFSPSLQESRVVRLTFPAEDPTLFQATESWIRKMCSSCGRVARIKQGVPNRDGDTVSFLVQFGSRAAATNAVTTLHNYALFKKFRQTRRYNTLQVAKYPELDFHLQTTVS
jgi:hypothetical protein